MTVSQESAETTGLQALTWLAAHEELLPVFLGATGASEATFRTGIDDPAFLGSVLDFILMDDIWVRAFCDAHGLAYDQPSRARMALPGGAQVNWT